MYQNNKILNVYFKTPRRSLDESKLKTQSKYAWMNELKFKCIGLSSSNSKLKSTSTSMILTTN